MRKDIIYEWDAEEIKAWLERKENITLKRIEFKNEKIIGYV